MPAPERLVAGADQLRTQTGEEFKVTEHPVDGTELHVIYVAEHSLPAKYSRTHGLFGFRAPAIFPMGCPEDSFFLAPDDLRLVTADPVRNSHDLNRAGKAAGMLKGTELGDISVLVFSWHLWNKVPWDRNKHTLLDHYQHCLRRLEQPEHD